MIGYLLEQYKFASLPELNAVLKQYNVLADRGTENSRVFKHHGLLYRMQDADGKPVGVPIKASMFYNKPTLPFLERKFKEHEVKPETDKRRVRNEIGMALMGNRPTLDELMKVLAKKGIHTALRSNETGLIYGITYVDHTTKCVFNGSALGKEYSAKAILERCTPEPNLLSHSARKTIGLQPQAIATAAETKATQNTFQTAAISNEAGSNLLNTLMRSENLTDYLPYELKGDKKKKRRGQNNNQ